ncbi:hypothetical protein LCGC14_1226020 [marine sediment metagenome]|uniref:Uncharacterized protein n=1 Tax=marine sediment metagenome TaxID=412755 RepID=A0A0F9PE92_9ZZZZ
MTRLGFTRPSRPRSTNTTVRFAPTAGFTEQPDIAAPLGSITSGQNVWVRPGTLEPRWRLEQTADNILNDVPVGAFLYDDVDGSVFPVVASTGTVAFLDFNSYVSLQYVSGVSNLPPTGADNDNIFGTSVYLPRRDLNIAVFTNGVEPLFAWGGPSDNTGFSTLTQGPIARDVSLFNNRPIAWNIHELSSASRVVNRVQWPVGGDPEDWTGIGSGFEDLVDMGGAGTRVIATEQEIILFSTREVWRGRRIGGEFIFQYSPLTRELGAPFAKAVLNTTQGIFWLGSDFNIWRYIGGQISPIGNDIQRTLRDTAQNLDTAFFSYNAELQQLTLFYAATPTDRPNRAFTTHIKDGAWTPQRMSFAVSQAFAFGAPSSATTWGGLQGTLSNQSQSYDDMLGLLGTPNEALLTSNGTTAFFTPSADSDLGATVHSQAVFGGLFGADADNIKYSHRLRMDFRGDSASSLSVAVSGNLGGTYQAEQEFAVSVQSATTQETFRFGIPGLYHAVRIEGDEGRWRVVSVKLDARLLGEAL